MRIKPAATALTQLFEGCIWASCGVKHIHHLAEQGNAGEERNRVTGQLQRSTFAVPVLVQRDAGGDLFTEPQLASNVRPR